MSILTRIFVILYLSLFYTFSSLHADIITYSLPDPNDRKIHGKKEIAYKDGTIYYITQNGASKLELYKVNNEGETRIKEINAKDSSPPVINDNGDIYFSTVKGGITYLNCINPNNAKEWSFPNNEIKWDFSESCEPFRIFTPVIIDEGNIFLQTRCGSIFIITSDGQKKYESKNFDDLSIQPVKVNYYEVLTGSDSRIYLFDVSDLILEPSSRSKPGIIPEDPKIPPDGFVPKP